MRSNFPPSLDFTLSWEGDEYVNHPNDPGGHTKKGITLATLRRYKPGASVADLKAIPDRLVAQIYKDGYWDQARCDTLAAGVDGAVFDYAVNSGPGAARKSLLKVVGGPDHVTVKKLCARRLSIYETFRHWKSFGRGWTNRVTAGEALWVKWALARQMDAPHVGTALADEGDKAGSTAKKQAAYGTGTGAGGAASTQAGTETADALASMVTIGLSVTLIAVAAWLLWRAHINRQRRIAFSKEARTLP